MDRPTLTLRVKVALVYVAAFVAGAALLIAAIAVGLWLNL